MVELTLHACINSDADDKDVIEILKKIKIFDKDNFVIDGTKEDIKNFCQEEIVRSEHRDDMRDMYYTGYRFGLCKVLEYIEGIQS